MTDRPLELLAVPGIGRSSGRFRWELFSQALEAGLEPDYIAAVISIESGFDPAAVNPHTRSHGGLIQFSKQFWPPIAKSAGRPGLSWQSMIRMRDYEQVPFVIAHYMPMRERLRTPTDYYMATFMPAYAGRSPNTVLGQDGSEETLSGTGLSMGKIYAQNEGLDVNHDGFITISDVGHLIEGVVDGAKARPRISVSEPPPHTKSGFKSALALGLAVGVTGLVMRRLRQ